MPEIESGYAAVDGGRLYYEAAGAGRPLVLVHSGLGDRRMWEPQWEEYAGRYRVVRYDLRGFGRSSVPEADFAQHDDLAALLRHLGIARTAVLGVSLGGEVALSFVVAYPEMVDALIVLPSATTGGRPPEEVREVWRRADELVEAGDVAAACELELGLWVDGPGRASGSADPAVREQVRVLNTDNFNLPDGAGSPVPLKPAPIERLGEIRVPTLVIVGEHEIPAILNTAERLEAGIAGAHRVVIPGAAHMVNMERPREFNRAVLEFLEGAY
jgi:3-oxoadipate enol-lactonase